MKTNRIILMLAVATVAAACNQSEIEGPSSSLKANEFMAAVDGVDSKVSMNAGHSLYWEKGDLVSVFAPDGSNNLFTSDAETGAASTVLHGGEDFVVDATKTYYAIYPYSADNSIEGNVITTVIPTVQTPVKGAFPVNHAVAVSSGQTLSFKNVCGLIGFEITQSDIVSVTLKSAGAAEYLTGKVKVTCGAEPAYEVVDGLTEVTLVTKDKFATGTYYVAVLPQAFTGLTVTMYKADGTVASVTNTAGFTLSRSHRLETGTIDGGTFGDKIMTISNAAELQGFLAAADSYASTDVVTLADDIDLSGYDLVPATSFAGTFDGASKSITNWNTTTALFNEVSGTVKDLTIAENCNLEVQQQGNAAFIALTNSGTISGCINNGTVTSVNEFTSERAIGTIAAVSTGTVISCTNNGSITLTPSVRVMKAAVQFIGGIVGQASASSAELNAMESCTNSGAVTFDGPFSSKLFIGGVCGGTPAGAGTFGDYGVFKTLRNTAAVTLEVPTPSSVNTTYINLGGVVGYAEADLDDCDNDGAVTVLLPQREGENSEYVFQRPAIAGVAGAVLYNATSCDNAGTIDIKGIFGAGSENAAGAGQFHGSMFGGVFGVVGCDKSACSVTECTNTGDLKFDLVSYSTASPYGYIGGVAAKADATMSNCSNKGVINVKNRMRGGYVGGVAGSSTGLVTLCDNGAAITYDLGDNSKDEISGNQSSDLFLGGIVGSADSDVTGCQSLDASIITVRNGMYRENKVFSIGGLVGQAKGSVKSTKKNTSLYVYGQMEIDTPSRVYVGGVAGQASGQLIDLRVESQPLDTKEIKVTKLGPVSYVGGVCGLKTKTNDARLIVRTTVDVNVQNVTDVYLAHLYGCWDFNGYYHSGTINAALNYSTSVTKGIIAGLVTADHAFEIGQKDNPVAIRKGCTYNGTSLGEYADLKELHGSLVGKVEGTVTVTAISQ